MACNARLWGPQLAGEAGIRVHPWTVGRALQRLRLTRKKKTLRAAEQDDAAIAAARAAWCAESTGGIAPKRLVFIDETATLTNMARTHARSRRGTRACGAAPHGHWTRLTVIGALGEDGMVVAMAIEATADGAVFAAYLAQVLLPALRAAKPNVVLVMDNLSAHKTATAAR